MLQRDRIHCMDALEGLKQLDDESVDLVVTDPPYNIASPNKLTFQKGSVVSTKQVWGQWDIFHPFTYEVLILGVLDQCYRVLKPGGALYMCMARESCGYFMKRALERGFVYRNQIALIRKNPLPSFYKNCWRSAYDLVFYLTKGKKTKTFNFLSQAEAVNTYTYGSHGKATKHPTEKPIEFIERLIRVSSNPGDLVLDPFMGGGTTAAACRKLGRHFIGFEINRDYIRMAEQRLKDLDNDKREGKAA